MAIDTAAAVDAAADAIKERFSPAFDAIEDNVRQARRAMVQGRRAAEDLAEDTAAVIRHHPLGAAAVALGAGAAIGCMLGYACGRTTARR